MVVAVTVYSVGRRALQLPSDLHEDDKRNRHDNHSAESQYEEPPEHPHGIFRIADD